MMNKFSLLILSVSLVTACGTGVDGPDGVYQHISSQRALSDQLSLTEMTGSRGKTASLVQADHLGFIARKLAGTEGGAGKSWTPFFGDRFSLQSAGSIPFPNHHGNHNYEANFFLGISANAAVRPAANHAYCTANPGHKDCPSENLCRNVAREAGSGENAIATMYLMLVGEQISAQTLADLTAIAGADARPAGVTAQELVCFAIMLSPKFLTY